MPWATFKHSLSVSLGPRGVDVDFTEIFELVLVNFLINAIGVFGRPRGF
jgi:hypothetical protein